MKRSLLLIALPCLLAFRFSGDTAWTASSATEYNTAMEKAKAYYRNQVHFAVQITHDSYKGYDATTPYEESKGYFRRNGSFYHSYLLGIHTLQDAKYKIMVDTANKRILVATPDNGSADAIAETNNLNIVQYVTRWQSASSGSGKKFRLEMNERPSYSAYETELSDEGQLLNLTIYYRNEYLSNPDDSTSAKKKPKLSISWSGFDTHTNWSQKEFDTGKYITVTNGVISPAAAYAGYSISDTRISSAQ